MNKQNIKKIIAFSMLGVFINFSFAIASELDNIEKFVNVFFENNNDITIIENRVESISNTGGSTAQGGEVVNGKSESILKVKSIVNGEVIEDIEIIEENEGETSIDYKTMIEINDDKLKIESTREINGQIEKRIDEFLIDEKSKEKIDVLLSEESNFIKKELEIEGGRYDEITFEIKDDEIASEKNNLEEDGSIIKFLNIILDLFKNNIDKINRLFY